ncbi:MAG TPA: 3-ketoacyl-ACP reductase [Pseudorhodoferax sp.]|jgi:NAD(P)-dependent dehydrogenase (short-subunit alcohol dehydrogenase family)|nr:3-ketoacyl-ACP reductase [Pseudorhodoferax sp.]
MTATPTPRAHALVTGGRRGIGRGIAYALAQQGFDVTVADLEQDEDAQQTLRGLRERGARAAFVHCDVADVDAHGAVLDAAEQGIGPLSCLVNNAGISVARRGDLLEATPESFDLLMRVNLRGPFFLTQKVAARFVARAGDGVYRSIVNISSANAYAASPNRGEYCLSKSAVSMATKLFATRLGEAGIGVFEIRPGVIRTGMTAVAAADYDQRIAAGLSPVRRWGEPEDVGKAAAALASGAFAFSTGDAVHVDGGLHIQRL